MSNLARGLSASNPAGWFAKNRVNIPGTKEVIWEPLYDTVTYPAGGAASLILFQDQIGKNGKTLSQTNMDLDGQLPKGKALKVVSVQLAFYCGNGSDTLVQADEIASFTTINDTRTFAENGSLKFRIQSERIFTSSAFG